MQPGPHRTIPRRRHDVSPRLQPLLAPLFRYSRWRDAWILRLVGERFGPVLIVRADDLAHDRDRPPLIEARSGLAALAAGGVFVAAALGFIIARSGESAARRPVRPSAAVSGLLEVTLPAGWHRLGAPATQPLALSDELPLRPARPAGGTLVLGRSPSAQPATVASKLVPTSSGPEPVTLGGAVFTRYVAAGGPAGGSSTAATPVAKSIYVLPTTAGMVVGMCIPGKDAPGFTAACEQVLGSLRLRSGTRTQGLPSSYAASLTAAINSLNTAQARAGDELAAARDARHQARAATKLAAAYIAAAAAIGRLTAGPAQSANTAVAAALRLAGRSYGSLAHAAQQVSVRSYTSASASVRRSAVALKSALEQLQPFGYRIG